MRDSACPEKRYRAWQGGFTLLEVLIALVIMAISLVIILQIFAGGLRNAWLSRDYHKAILMAQEKMEELCSLEDLSPGVRTGEIEGGYVWRAEIRPYSLPQASPWLAQLGEQLTVEPYEVTLKLSLRNQEEGRSITLSTLILPKRATFQRVSPPTGRR